MWTREHAVERLHAMESRCRMYASNKESFTFQVMTIIESMGYSVHPNDLIERALGREGSAYVHGNDSVSDEWAREWMVHVWKAIKEAGV